MARKQLLDEWIGNSGLKISFIADKLGLSRAGFDMKRNGEIPFRKAEIYVLCDLLRITDEAEQEKIFPEKVKV